MPISAARNAAAYPPGPFLTSALEAYCRTVEEQATLRAKEEVPTGVCEGLHSGPPRGLVCRACHDAEVGAPFVAQVEAEIEMARKKVEELYVETLR